jgi:hypothetical protein
LLCRKGFVDFLGGSVGCVCWCAVWFLFNGNSFFGRLINVLWEFLGERLILN